MFDKQFFSGLRVFNVENILELLTIMENVRTISKTLAEIILLVLAT